MNETMMGIIQAYGYYGIFFLIFIENIFPPIPSEVILLFGGSASAALGLSVPVTIMSATFGSLLGALMLYYIGYRFNAEKLKKIFSGRLGRMTRIKPEYVDISEKWFAKYQNKAVLFCRCVPLVRSFISIPAGFSKMRPLPFALLTAAGSAVWNSVLIFAGVALGEAWARALPYIDRYSRFIAVAAAAVLALLIASRVVSKRKKE